MATALFPPGIPAFLAVLQVFKLNHFTELLVRDGRARYGHHAALAQLGRRVGGDTVGLVAGAIAAVYPNLLLGEGALMTEALTALLVTLALILALRAIELAVAPQVPRTWASAHSAGAHAQRRLAVRAAARGDCRVVCSELPMRLAAILRACGAGLIASVVLVGAWLVRDEAQMHTFVPFAVNSWDVIAGANSAGTYSGGRFGSWDARASCSTRPSTPAGGARSR